MEVLTLNKTAVEMLEYDKIILDLSNYAVSEKGKEVIANLEPSLDINVVKHWLKETSEAKEIINKSSSIPLHQLNGIDKIIEKIDKGINLLPSELNSIYEFIKSGNKMKKFMADKEILAPLVSSYAFSIYDLDDTAQEIYRCIRYDRTDDNATQKLFKVRRKMAVIEEKVKEKLNSIIKSSSASGYIQDNLISMRNGKYVIPVKNSYKNQIDGNIMDTSSSGSTVFVEPKGVRKLQDELNQLKYQEEEEVYQILAYLTDMVRNSKKEILINIETMVHYDFLFAKAKYSKAIDGKNVELNTGKQILIKAAKHPLIGKNAVPLDFEIGKDFKGLIITGPNTGGKTVVLKTVGLLIMMVQSGLHIPVKEGSSFALFNDILVDIGDGQSIEQSLSTFSSHIRNIISILECADEKTMVIMDELGAGTDPSEGMGLAVAILEHIHKKNAIVLATTHYSEIKGFAKDRNGFENGSMEFNIETLKPTYRLQIGKSGESNAFLIALKLGMNKSLIERAHEITYRERKDYDQIAEKQTEQQVFKNIEVVKSHIEKKEIYEKLQETKKMVEKKKVKNTFNIGDSVFIKSMNATGIICELENNKGEIGVLVKKKKLKINKKRVSLFIEGKDLYPEEYDLDIVLETKENRKKRNLIKRKYVKDIKIESGRDIND